MNWNPSLQKNLLRSGVCLALCGAILLGLFLPAGNMIHSQPENPLENGAIRDISILEVGEDVTDMEDIVVPNEDSAAPTERDEEVSEQTQPPETQPEESQETQPPETQPQQPEPEVTEATEPEDGDDDEGNDDGDQGEEGGDPLEVDLAGVMIWYKYGTDPNTIACGPSGTVFKSINVAQLTDNTLKYEFTLTGDDAKYVEITNVSVAAGDGTFRKAAQNGEQKIELPEGNGDRNYTFAVTAAIEKPNADGETVQQEITFTFVLKCEYNLDLELELTWRPLGGNSRTVACGPDKTERFSVKNYELHERVFGYSLQLAGGLAENAKIISAAYTTASGQKSGELELGSGTLILDPAPGTDKEVYEITVTVQAPDREVLYTFKLTYEESLDAQLKFNWMENGTVPRTKTCEAEGSISLDIKKNQLSAGAIPYTLELTGDDGAEGRILSVTYTCAGGSGNLESAGSLTMTMPEGASANTYILTVTAMVNGQRITFTVNIHFSADVSVLMEYTVRENGAEVTRQILCENTKSKTAEAVYDDQLTDGILHYTMSLQGSEGEIANITSVTCYQSGSGKTVTLQPQGQISLLQKGGKTGENTFEIQAQDAAGSTYRFTINIPYKHRGENSIKIATNLAEGQEIINDTKTNLTVRAWSEDANGNVIGYIPANGTDTKLIVQLDGETLSYVSSSGAASEYDLYPKNPEVGDTNTHILYIYAEDALGNYGELTLNLKGQRRESGQKVGTAAIYVDMTCVGLGVVANLSYDILADEPVSYVIAKAIMGMDTGEPFGAAPQTLGWAGRYAGSLDNGFYLQSLTTGHTANALEDAQWPGSTEEEVLAAIDKRFGAGTGLATLWRCLYRNGLNKSTGSGNSFGEFDYTSGSGWMYSVGGSTYYPGQSMSSVYLHDGDVLIVRYTLAYGWDVGGGSPSYGNTVGYCAAAVNGSITINHRIEEVVREDGSVVNICRCCGIEEDCAHINALWMDLEDGTHIRYCNDCKKELGDPIEHGWTYEGENADTSHSCPDCGAAEDHNWQEVEGSNTATCTQPGVRNLQCPICHMIREEESAPKGHTLDNQWQMTAAEHYEKCSTCGEIANQGLHQYQQISFMENGEAKTDYECSICHALHIDECDGTLTQTGATCQKINYYCDGCGYELVREGFFEEHHSYVDGSCTYCGAADPGSGETEPSDPEPSEPEPSEPEPSEPEHSEPKPSEPEPTEPEPSEPEPTEPEPTEPEPTEPEPSEDTGDNEET